MHSPTLNLPPRDLVVCPSLRAEVDRAFFLYVGSNEMTVTNELVTQQEFQRVEKLTCEFLERIKTMPTINHLMHVRHTLLPFVLNEFAVDQASSKGRQAAINRLNQMLELFDFFVAISELEPANAWELLNERVLPQRPPGERYDPGKFRHCYGSGFALPILAQLTEELALYCRCK